METRSLDDIEMTPASCGEIDQEFSTFDDFRNVVTKAKELKPGFYDKEKTSKAKLILRLVVNKLLELKNINNATTENILNAENHAYVVKINSFSEHTLFIKIESEKNEDDIFNILKIYDSSRQLLFSLTFPLVEAHPLLAFQYRLRKKRQDEFKYQQLHKLFALPLASLFEPNKFQWATGTLGAEVLQKRKHEAQEDKSPSPKRRKLEAKDERQEDTVKMEVDEEEATSIECIWLNEENPNEFTNYIKKVSQPGDQPQVILQKLLDAKLEDNSLQKLFTDVGDGMQQLGIRFEDKDILISVESPSNHLILEHYQSKEELFKCSFNELQVVIQKNSELKFCSLAQVSRLEDYVKTPFLLPPKAEKVKTKNPLGKLSVSCDEVIFSDFEMVCKSLLSKNLIHKLLSNLIDYVDPRTKTPFFVQLTGDLYQTVIVFSPSQKINFKIYKIKTIEQCFLVISDYETNQKLLTVNNLTAEKVAVEFHNIGKSVQARWSEEELDSVLQQLKAALGIQQINSLALSPFLTKSKSKKLAPGMSWKTTMPVNDLQKLINTHKNESWEIRLQKVFYDNSYKETRIFSGKEYAVYSQYIEWQGTDGETYQIKASFNTAEVMRPPFYLHDGRCTSWCFPIGKNGLPVPLFADDIFYYKSNCPALYELRFFQKGNDEEDSELLRDWGTRDTFPETKTHTSLGELQGISVGRGKFGVPGNEILNLYLQTYLPLFGRKKTYVVDAANLEASDYRATSFDSLIEEFARVNWNNVTHGVKLGLSSLIEYDATSYKRSIEKTNKYKFHFLEGNFVTAHEGKYSQSETHRQQALKKLPHFPLRSWYTLLEKQSRAIEKTLAEKKKKLQEQVHHIPELKIDFDSISLDDASKNTLETYEKLEEEINKLLKLVKTYYQYQELVSNNKYKAHTCLKESLLEKLNENTEIKKMITRKLTLEQLLEDDQLDDIIESISTSAKNEKLKNQAAFDLIRSIRQYRELQWVTYFPTILKKLAVIGQLIADKKRSDNPFVDDNLTVAKLHKTIKEFSIKKGGMGPASEFLAFNNLLTQGVSFDIPPARKTSAANTIEEFRNWVQELTAGSLYFAFESTDVEPRVSSSSSRS